MHVATLPLLLLIPPVDGRGPRRLIFSRAAKKKMEEEEEEEHSGKYGVLYEKNKEVGLCVPPQQKSALLGGSGEVFVEALCRIFLYIITSNHQGQLSVLTDAPCSGIRIWQLK